MNREDYIDHCELVLNYMTFNNIKNVFHRVFLHVEIKKNRNLLSDQAKVTPWYHSLEKMKAKMEIEKYTYVIIRVNQDRMKEYKDLKNDKWILIKNQ
jgi:hypothetical protein